MNNYFDIGIQFDPHRCWDLGCHDVDETLIRDENDDIIDEELYCNGSHDDINKCPLRKYYYDKMMEAKSN